MAQLLRGWITVADYHRMAECGILTEDDRVELLQGQVVAKTSIGPPHAGCVNRLNRVLAAALGDRATIAVQNPAVLDDWSEPEPDIIVLRARADGYATGHPQPADILLLIEVGDSSIERDREVKMPLYAAAGIVEVWLVDLPAGRVELYRAPGKAGYASVRVAARGESVTPLSLADLSLSVEEILG
jgi:Uma2 family endonuclease